MVDTNGTKAYRFKRGFEPGSPAYEGRPAAMAPSPSASLVGRGAKQGVHTTVVMGKTQMQWGCDTDVKDKIRAAAKALCPESGGCDRGSSQGWDVAKWEGDDAAPSGARLNLRLEGKYATRDSHDALLEALLATATGDSAPTEKRKWLDRATESGSHWGLTSRGGECAVSTFPNYVAVNRFDGEDLMHSIEFHAELVEGESKSAHLLTQIPLFFSFHSFFRALIILTANCLAPKILGAIAGAINPIAGKFFGGVSAICETQI